MNKKIYILLATLFISYNADAQIIPNPLKGKGISVGGMISANHIYYSASGIPDRNIPFNVLYSGNLAVNIFDKIKMPVSFSLSNQNINFSHPFDKKYRFAQPFNRMVLKPTYKGLTLHLGTVALNFSPYTLAGHRFDGVGLEYKPKGKPFFVGAMAGNLQRAVAIDTAFTVRNNRPSYKRTGYGFTTGYRKNKDKFELIFFTAKDKINSLSGNLDALNIAPLENSVMSFKAEKALLKVIAIGGEVAYSGITTDTRAELSTEAHFAKNFFGTISSRNTTDYLKAMRAFINYNGKKFNTGFDYSRVDPGYRTLGAYFFTNDLETYAVKAATSLFTNKVTVAGNLGIQQDNVWKQKPKTLRRNVGSLNVNYIPNKNLNLSVAYSNFTSFSNVQSSYAYLTQITPYDYLDSLNFRQINSNLQTNASWKLPIDNEKISHTISALALIQNGADQQGNQNTSNDLNNINLDYGFDNEEKKIGFNTAFNFSKSNFGDIPNTQFGPSIGFHFEKYKIINNLSMLYSISKMPDVKEQVTNVRYGAKYIFKDQHHFKFDFIYLNRKAKSTERSIPNFDELTITLGYVYNFKLLDKKIK